MARKQHNEEEVLKALRAKNDVKISGKTVLVLKDKVFNTKTKEIEDNPFKKNDLGNSSWGKIDYLCNYCNYNLNRVDNF